MLKVFKCVLNTSRASIYPTILLLDSSKCLGIPCVPRLPSKWHFHCRTYCSKKDKQLTTYVPRNFHDIDQKNKDSFLEMIDVFIEITRKRSGHVEFIDSALKYMKEFGVHKDLEVYKALINVLPKGKLVPENFLQSEFMHYPKQQNCIINLLEQMEDNGKMTMERTQF